MKQGGLLTWDPLGVVSYLSSINAQYQKACLYSPESSSGRKFLQDFII